MADNWDQVDPRDAQILDLTTELHSTKATFVLLTNVVANNNSNNRGRNGPDSSRRDGPKDWQYIKEGDTKEVKGKT
jgi:hypothetical protein